ncbi:hypothetical protein Hanom_Chr07g00634481 [Helianthus anomalus]
MNPNFGLAAEEADAIVSSPPRSTEQPVVVSSTVETPTVMPQVAPARTIASTIRATTSQQALERQQRKFSEMQQDEKAADEERKHQLQQIRAADNARGIDMNHLKEWSTTVQRLAETLKAKHDDMKEWYNSRNTKITDGVKKINDGFENETLKKRDHDSEDPGNPDPSATSKQPPATVSTQIVVFEPPQTESTQGTFGGTVEEIQQLESSSYVESSLACTTSVPSSADLALLDIHHVTGEVLEEGEIVADLSNEQLLALNEMKTIDDAANDNIPSEPESADVENPEKIVIEGETRKLLKENVDDIDQHLKDRDTTGNAPDAFTEWRKQFLSKVTKPTPAEAQVDYLTYEKENLHAKILCWMFVKEIHCMAIKREHDIQYFSSLLSILSLPFYDVAALTKLELINRSNFERATLFARKIKMNRRTC